MSASGMTLESAGSRNLFVTVAGACEWGCDPSCGEHAHCSKCGHFCNKSDSDMTKHYADFHNEADKGNTPDFVSNNKKVKNVSKPCHSEGQPHYHLNWPSLEQTLLFFINTNNDRVYGDGTFLPPHTEEPGLRSVLNQYVCLDTFLQDLPVDAIPYIMELQEKFCQAPPYTNSHSDSKDARSYVPVSSFLLFILVASRWSAKCAAFQNDLMEALCSMSFPSSKCWKRTDEKCRLKVFRGRGQHEVSSAQRKHCLIDAQSQTTFSYHVDGKLDIVTASMKIKSDNSQQAVSSNHQKPERSMDFYEAHLPGNCMSRSTSPVNITIDQGPISMNLEVLQVKNASVNVTNLPQMPRVIATEENDKTIISVDESQIKPPPLYGPPANQMPPVVIDSTPPLQYRDKLYTHDFQPYNNVNSRGMIPPQPLVPAQSSVFQPQFLPPSLPIYYTNTNTSVPLTSTLGNQMFPPPFQPLYGTSLPNIQPINSMQFEPRAPSLSGPYLPYPNHYQTGQAQKMSASHNNSRQFMDRLPYVNDYLMDATQQSNFSVTENPSHQIQVKSYDKQNSSKKSSSAKNRRQSNESAIPDGMNGKYTSTKLPYSYAEAPTTIRNRTPVIEEDLCCQFWAKVAKVIPDLSTEEKSKEFLKTDCDKISKGDENSEKGHSSCELENTNQKNVSKSGSQNQMNEPENTKKTELAKDANAHVMDVCGREDGSSENSNSSDVNKSDVSLIETSSNSEVTDKLVIDLTKTSSKPGKETTGEHSDNNDCLVIKLKENENSLNLCNENTEKVCSKSAQKSLQTEGNTNDIGDSKQRLEKEVDKVDLDLTSNKTNQNRKTSVESKQTVENETVVKHIQSSEADKELSNNNFIHEGTVEKENSEEKVKQEKNVNEKIEASILIQTEKSENRLQNITTPQETSIDLKNTATPSPESEQSHALKKEDDVIRPSLEKELLPLKDCKNSSDVSDIQEVVIGHAVIDKADEDAIVQLIKSGECKSPYCELCFTIFDTQRYANLHSVLHRLALQDGIRFEGKMRCLNCDVNGHFWNLMLKHLMHHHGERLTISPLACVLCGLEFDSKINMEFHQSFHYNSKLYRCIYCSSVRGSWNLMKEHLELCSVKKDSPMQKYYSCPFCNQKMYTIEERLLHVHSHSDSGFCCVMCKTYKNYGWTQMKRHYLAAHFYKTDWRGKVTLPRDVRHWCLRPDINRMPPSAFMTVRLKDTLCPIATTRQTYKCIFNCEVFLETSEYAKLHSDWHSQSDPENPGQLCQRDQFSCPKCDFNTYSWFMLLNHLKRVHKEVYVNNEATSCYLCGLDFPDADTLMKHKDAHANSHLKCNWCAKSINTWHNVQEHWKVCTKLKEEPNYACAYCHLVFKRKDERELHMDSHADAGYRCVHCDDFDEDQANWSILKKHYMQKHDLSVYKIRRTFKCPDCDKVYKNRKGIKQHRFTVHEGGTHPCEECNKRFKSQDALRVHIDSKHGPKVKCVKCEFTGYSSRSMKIHYQVEHEGKTHVCERCAMCFISVEELQTHGDNCHNNDADSAPGDISKSGPSNEESPKSSTSPIKEPEVKCLKCEFTATSRTDMKHHYQVEHEGKTVACDQCDDRFVTSEELQKHVSKCHVAADPNSVQCNVCKTWLANEKQLKRHKLYQHNPHRIPMRCTLCGYRTFIKHALKTHMIKKHDLEAPQENDQSEDGKGASKRRNVLSKSKTNDSEEDSQGLSEEDEKLIPKRRRRSSKIEGSTLTPITEEYTYKRHMSIYTTPRARASALAKMERIQRANERKEDERMQNEIKKLRKQAEMLKKMKQREKRRKRNLKNEKESKEKEKKIKKSRKMKQVEEEKEKKTTVKKEEKVKRKKSKKESPGEIISEQQQSQQQQQKPVKEKTSPPKSNSKKEKAKKVTPVVHRYRPLSEPHCDHTYCKRPANENDPLFSPGTLAQEALEPGHWLITDDEIFGVEVETSPNKNVRENVFSSAEGVAMTDTVTVRSLAVNSVTSSETVSLSIVNSGLHSSLQSSFSEQSVDVQQIPQLASLAQNQSQRSNISSLLQSHGSQSVRNQASDLKNCIDDDVDIPETSGLRECNEQMIDKGTSCEHSYASRSSKPEAAQEMQYEIGQQGSDASILAGLTAEQSQTQIFDGFINSCPAPSATSETPTVTMDTGVSNNSEVIDSDMLPNMDILDALMQQSVQDNEELLSFLEKD